MQSQKTIFTEYEVLCRPLVLASPESKNYIDLPYTYKLKEIKDLQTYICPSLRIVGVDFVEKTATIPKTKYKKLLYQQIDSQSNQRAVFQKKEEFQRLFWVVDVAIPHLQSPDELKNFIRDSLALCIKVEGQELFLTEENVNLESLKKSLLYLTSSIPKSLRKNGLKPKIFINKIEIGLVLEKKQSYSLCRILDFVAGQLSSSIKIMETNQLLFQTNKWHQELVPIRNFSMNSKDKDGKFERLCSGESAGQEKKPQIQVRPENLNQENGEGKIEKIALIGLVVILMLVVGIYFGLRFIA